MIADERIPTMPEDFDSDFLNEVLSDRTHVQIVFSKWDLVTRSDEQVGGVSYVEYAQSEISKRFSQAFGTLNFHRITARDPTGGPPAGMDQLLTTWITNRRLRCALKSQDRVDAGSRRPFDEFLSTSAVER